MGFPLIPLFGGIWAGLMAFKGLLNPGSQGQPPAQPETEKDNTLLIVILAIVGLFAIGLIFRKK